MKIAIIGSGISGLTCSYYLARHHQVTVFENDFRIGGHTATIEFDYHGANYAIDTGFIVYNDWTYPNFIRLLDEIGAASRPAEMSFSVSCEVSGLEYAGSNFNTLFADRRNICRPKYWRMLLEIVRFNRQAITDLESEKLDANATLGDYLKLNNYSQLFIEKYLVPMGAAIWSSGTDEMLEFPLLFFVRFFKNHGLLSVKNRPQWYTLLGGSKSYIEPLTRTFAGNIHTSTSIEKIERTEQAVMIAYRDIHSGEVSEASFDALVIATHSDQALALLDDGSVSEQEILTAIPYQANDVVLHTDETLLPRRKLAWSSWNSRLIAVDAREPVARLTYNMNILQGIEADTTFCVSLNQTSAINPEKILGNYTYSHPVFTVDGVAAQQRWQEIAGTKNTWYCGAYWGSGFHEDGVVSGMRAAASINRAFGFAAIEPLALSGASNPDSALTAGNR